MNEVMEVSSAHNSKVATQVVEVGALALIELLEGASLHVCKDKSLSVITNVLLNAEGDGYLTATATDRYRLGEGKVEVEYGRLAPSLVQLGDAKRIIDLLKSYKLAKVTLSRIEGSDILTVGVAGQALSVLLMLGDFPPSEHLFAAIEEAPVPVEGVAFNPLFFADYAKIAGKNNPVKVYFGGNGKPMRIRITSTLVEWRLLLMPMRYQD